MFSIVILNYVVLSSISKIGTGRFYLEILVSENKM